MIDQELLLQINNYIAANYVSMPEKAAAKMSVNSLAVGRSAYSDSEPLEDRYEAMPMAFDRLADDDIENYLKIRDESFVEMLLRKIDEAGIKDSECYNKAGVSRGHFNKIKNRKDYRVQKKTVLAFILALRLDADEADEMMTKAGYAFSPSSKRDLIVKFCLEHRIYDITQVNEILYKFDQELLS